MMKKNDEMHVFIKAMLSRSRKLVILLILIIAGSVITSLIPPLVLEKAVNRLSNHQSVSFLHALSYFLFIVLADVLESLQNACITIFGQKMTHNIRSALCNKLSHLPAQYFHTHKAGEIESVFTNDGDTIDVLYSDGIVSMIADCFKLIAILIVIFTRSIGLGLLLAAVTPFLYLFTRWCQKKMNNAQLKNRRAIARVNSHVPETIRCIRMIHGFHAQKYMEDTYDAHIARGGTNISGGQKQRLAIARAIARDPEIYIFDDSFSALDYKTDSVLRNELRKYTKDATVMIVAQRIGTIINADKIVVLDEGECVGIGTHKELLKKCKVYKEIALSQLSKEELENA